MKDGSIGRVKVLFPTGHGYRFPVIIDYDLVDCFEASLVLHHASDAAPNKGITRQRRIKLAVTFPALGGRKWFMICPFTKRRVAKLYLPYNCDQFASRQYWDLVYRSQYANERGRTFARLSKLQRKLGCEEVWGAELTRPKGMWQKTFKKHIAKYERLDDRCMAYMTACISDLRERQD